MTLEKIILIILIVITSIILLLFLFAKYITSAIFSQRSDGSPRLKYRTYDFYNDLDGTKVSIKSNNNQTLNGYIYKNKANKDVDGLIVFFHGFSAGHYAYLDLIHRLTKMNYDVIAFDNTGCCISTGKCVKGLAQGDIDSEYIYKFVKELKEYKNKQIISMGHSWGGHVSTTFAKDHSDLVNKCVTIAPFDNNCNLYFAFAPFFKFLKPFIYLSNLTMFDRKHLRSAKENIQNITIPTLYISGDNDKTLNKEFALNLFVKIDNPLLTKLILKDKGHQPYLTLRAQKYMEEKLLIVVNHTKKNNKSFVYKPADIDYDLINELDEEVMENIYNFLNK